MRFIDTRHDRWQRVEGEDGPVPHPNPQSERLLTLEQWHAVRDTWPRNLPTGVMLPNTLDVDTLAEDLRGPRSRLALVVLQFPKWTDGRAYSQARALRARRPVRAARDGEDGSLHARGRESRLLEQVIIATDDRRIMDAAAEESLGEPSPDAGTFGQLLQAGIEAAAA